VHCSHKIIAIGNNQIGITYEKLFCDHFAIVDEIIIFEPYIRKEYQLNNLKELVFLLKEKQ